jgi:hypothetical protein
MSFLRPIQWYHYQADPIWPDGTFKTTGNKKNFKLGKTFYLFFKSPPIMAQSKMPVRHVTGTGSGLIGEIPRVVVQISALT